MIFKVTNPFRIYRSILLIFLALIVQESRAQDTALAQPPVTRVWKDYVEQVLHDSTKKMVELKTLIPGLAYDLRYASKNNFMRRLMYPAKTRITFLRQPAAQALQRVQAGLAMQGLGLKIFDAYRPYSVTVKFWELVKDERYVANPAKGSGHNRGIAVDLTLIDLRNGQELDMGTGFDNFTDTAHQSFRQLPEVVLQNRQLLRLSMEKQGFMAFETEWWHFFLSGGSRFELLDFDFRKFKAQ